jgi:hypothetical protein
MRRNHFFLWVTIPAALLVLSLVSAGDPPANQALALKVILATPERNIWQIADNQSHLTVILENTSDKPIELYDSWNSWGWYNVKLEWQTKDGKGTVRPVQRAWTQNSPTVTEVPPGGAIVREVDLGKDWRGWPPLLVGQTMTIHAIYESKDDGDTKKLGWQGKVESPAITIDTRDNRLDPAMRENPQ